MNTYLHVKYPLILSEYNETWIFWIDFRKKILEHQIELKSFQWEPSCSMRKDRQAEKQTDVQKLTVAFRNLSSAPENADGLNTLK